VTFLQNTIYVATGSERFRKMAYRTGGSTQSAPVMKRKPLPPIGIKKRRQRSPIQSPVKEYDDIVQQMSARGEAQKGKETDIFAGKAVKVKGRQSLLSPQPPVSTEILQFHERLVFLTNFKFEFENFSRISECCSIFFALVR